MKKILSIILMLVLLLGINTNVYAKDFNNYDINEQNKINVGKYVKGFVNAVSKNKNIEIGDVNQLYDENENINGFCVDLIDNGESSGYVIVKFADNNPVVSEYAIEKGIKNPYNQILSKNNLDEYVENYRLYSIGINDYQIIKDREVLSFDEDVMSVDEFELYKDELEKSLYNSSSDDYITYSNLDGFTVISDEYKGTPTDEKTVLRADSVQYYDSRSVISIGKTYGCAVVALSNLMKYYRANGYIRIEHDFSKLYTKLWNYTDTDDNGATLNGNMSKAAKKYIKNVGYKLSHHGYQFNNYSGFVRELRAEAPCLFSYGAMFGEERGGHVVLVLGYVETTDYQYLKIADGWHNYLRYINFNGYSYDWQDGQSFKVSK